MGRNKIGDISKFSEAKFKNLKNLDLFDNQITDIGIFKNNPFKNIEKLDISYNSLKSVEALLQGDFSKLTNLKFEGNRNLDYSNSNPNIKDVFDKFKIAYNYNSITSL